MKNKKLLVLLIIILILGLTTAICWSCVKDNRLNKPVSDVSQEDDDSDESGEDDSDTNEDDEEEEDKTATPDSSSKNDGNNTSRVKMVTVSYYAEKGNPIVFKKDKVEYGKASKFASTPEKEGTADTVYVFDKWVLEDGTEPNLSKITKDITVYAKYVTAKVKGFQTQDTVTVMDTVPLKTSNIVVEYEAQDIVASSVSVTDGTDDVEITKDSFIASDWKTDYVATYKVKLPNNKTVKLKKTFDVTHEWYHNLNGIAGTTTVMKTGLDKITVKGEEKAVAFMAAKEGYNYPGAVFAESNSLNWGNDKAVSFKVYNPSNYDYNFEVRAYKEGYPETNASNVGKSTVLLRGVTVKAKQTETVTIYQSMFDSTVYPYLGFFARYSENGSVAAGKAGGERMGNLRLYFYDFVEKAETEPDTDDYKWTKTSSLSQAFTAINTDKTYIADGDYSLFFIPNANWPSFVLNESAEIPWTLVNKLSFKIYNPTSYEQHITMTRGTMKVKEYELAAKAWTTIEITDFAGWTDGELLRFSTGWSSNVDAEDTNNPDNANNRQWVAYKDKGLYFDSFELDVNEGVSAAFDKVAYCLGDTVTVPSAFYLDDMKKFDCTFSKVTCNGNNVTLTNGQFTINSSDVYKVHYTYDGGKTCAIDVPFSALKYYELNGTAGTTAIMNTGVEKVTVGDAIVYAAYATSKVDYNYPGAVFIGSDDFTWGSDKAISFKVYNPTEYDYNFEVRAYKNSYPESNASNINNSSVRLQGVTLKSKEVATVTIYGSMLDDWTAYPYLGIYMSYANNGGIAAGKTGGERMDNLKLYFYDFVETTGTEPHTDDYKWTKTSAMNQAFTASNTNKTYITDGDYSLFFAPNANWPSFVLTESGKVSWSLAKELSFKVYNPTSYEQHITLTRGTTKIKDYELAAKAWTTIKITDFEGWTDGESLKISTGWSSNLDAEDTDNPNNANNRQWVAYKNQGLYFDCFELDGGKGITAMFDKAAYCMGDTVTIPSATYLENMTQYDCTFSKVTCNGTDVEVTGGQFTITSSDVYTIHYTYNGGKTCEVDVVFSALKYYELNATTGTTALMNTGVKSVKVGKDTVYASYATVKEGYDYPGAVFAGTNAITWGTDKSVSFKVYNPTDYDYNFEVRAYKEGHPESNVSNIGNVSVLLQGVTVKAKEVKTVTIYSSMLGDWTTYPYLGIYARYTENGSIKAGTAGGERMENLQLYFYDFIEATGTEPITDDYKWTKTSSLSQAFTAINTDKTYIADGEYSLFFIPNANWPSFTLSESDVKWSEVSKFSFEVYNPTSYEQRIKLTRGTTSVKEYQLAANAWTTIEITDCAGWTDGELLKFSTGWSSNLDAEDTDNPNTDKNRQWVAYKNHGLYFDNFEVIKKAYYALNGTTAGGTVLMNTGVESIKVGESDIEAAYVASKVGYNYPGAVFAESNTIVWNGNKAVRFKVYNPTDYVYNFDVRAYKGSAPESSTSNLGNVSVVLQRVTVEAKSVETVTIYGSTFDATIYPYLGIYTNHSRNGGVAAGAQGGERMENLKLYFYDFAEKTEAVPTSDDYKWTQTSSENDAFTAVNTNKAYIDNGDYSLSFMPTGNNPTFVLSESGMNWSEVGKLTFKVYNPTSYEQHIRLRRGTTSWSEVEHYQLAANAWTTIEITDFTGWTDGDNLRFSTTATDAGGNTTDKWIAYKNQGVYFDSFKVTTK